MITRGVLLTGFVLSCASSVAAAEPIQITAALEAGHYLDQRALTGELAVTGERTLWFTRLMAGVSYSLTALPHDWTLRGQSSIGPGLLYLLGEIVLVARQEVRLNYAIKPWLALQAGLGLGAQVGFTRSPQSTLEVGAFVGLRLAERVEVLYAPMLSVPLRQHTELVLGGTLTSRVATAVTPVGFVLRVGFNVKP